MAKVSPKKRLLSSQNSNLQLLRNLIKYESTDHKKSSGLWCFEPIDFTPPNRRRSVKQLEDVATNPLYFKKFTTLESEKKVFKNVDKKRGS